LDTVIVITLHSDSYSELIIHITVVWLLHRQMVMAYVSATTSALVTALSFKSFMSTVWFIVM